MVKECINTDHRVVIRRALFGAKTELDILAKRYGGIEITALQLTLDWLNAALDALDEIPNTEDLEMEITS